MMIQSIFIIALTILFFSCFEVKGLIAILNSGEEDQEKAEIGDSC